MGLGLGLGLDLDLDLDLDLGIGLVTHKIETMAINVNTLGSGFG